MSNGLSSCTRCGSPTSVAAGSALRESYFRRHLGSGDKGPRRATVAEFRDPTSAAHHQLVDIVRWLAQ